MVSCHSAGLIPERDMPVSAITPTTGHASPCQERAWSMRLRACAREGTPRASSASKAGVRSMAGSHIQAKMVAGSPSFIGPASRSSRASGTVATPSTAAPWSTAVCAMRSAPWL